MTHIGKSSTWFTRFSKAAARATGSPYAFLTATTVVVIWAITGPLFGFHDTWQLVINSGTTIVTFLMVFLIQNTQNRDSAALQIKLDELIRANKDAHKSLLVLEELEEKDLEQIRHHYTRLAEAARDDLDVTFGE